jgi:diketogulonate reductase-like aldo/keto reductase
MPMAATLTVQGTDVPHFFYGTAWKEERTEALTRLALRSGFSAIDTANQRKHYFEAAVGAGVLAVLAEGKLRRETLFLQTKFTYARGQDQRLPYDPAASPETQVAQSFASSLEHFGTTYMDSLLLHGPELAQGLSRSDWAVWSAMEALQASGKTRLIGISNVAIDQLEALEKGATIKPAFVQNRCYARDGWDREVRSFCAAHGILYQGFSLLTANQRELQHPTIDAMVRRTGRTLPQLVFGFARAVGMIPITGTSSMAHMQEDLASFDTPLGADDVRAIESVGMKRA